MHFQVCLRFGSQKEKKMWFCNWIESLSCCSCQPGISQVVKIDLTISDLTPDLLYLFRFLTLLLSQVSKIYSQFE